MDERIAEMSDKEILEIKPKIGGVPPGQRERCTRQVYTNQVIAEKSVESLRKLAIIGTIERCRTCGMLHINETRTKA